MFHTPESVTVTALPEGLTEVAWLDADGVEQSAVFAPVTRGFYAGLVILDGTTGGADWADLLRAGVVSTKGAGPGTFGHFEVVLDPALI